MNAIPLPSRPCPEHFDWPHRYPTGVDAEMTGTTRMDVPMVGQAYTVLTRECTRCLRKAFACDCQTSAHWLDWPDPVRKCGKCGREWWLAGHLPRRQAVKPCDDEGPTATVGVLYAGPARLIGKGVTRAVSLSGAPLRRWIAARLGEVLPDVPDPQMELGL